MILETLLEEECLAQVLYVVPLILVKVYASDDASTKWD